MDDKKKKELAIRSSAAEYLTFVASTGESDASFEMRYENENIWLTQKMMAALYDVSVAAINQHLKRIFEDGELREEAVVKKYLITATDGKNYNTNHYNLQAIIAVGFKVNNQRAVQFRKWAGQIVKDHTIQGWTMDVERLKKGHMFTDEYFERQLQQIREIRLSERKFYQKVTDLYATAFDYDKNAKTTRLFFQTVQNKMHYAVHRHTAAELIVERADAKKEHMGLTTWENAPDGKILKADVTIAKNYLSKEEMNYLERIVSLYLDYAELQAECGNPYEYGGLGKARTVSWSLMEMNCSQAQEKSVQSRPNSMRKRNTKSTVLFRIACMRATLTVFLCWNRRCARKMKFNFKIQQYQTDAVDAVVKVFQGQGYHDKISYIRDLGKKQENSRCD